ncbi:MAG: hypothetical protein R3E13_00570 [Alphaproteobacteria bacterium]
MRQIGRIGLAHDKHTIDLLQQVLVKGDELAQTHAENLKNYPGACEAALALTLKVVDPGTKNSPGFLVRRLESHKHPSQDDSLQGFLIGVSNSPLLPDSFRNSETDWPLYTIFQHAHDRVNTPERQALLAYNALELSVEKYPALRPDDA